jgi:hypothetical protein
MRCILHVGPTKTGSTSIQYFLKEQAAALAGAGFFIPALSGMNMIEFNVAPIRSGRFEPSRATRRLGLTPRNFERRIARFRRTIEAQFRAAKIAGFHTALVTSEGLCEMGMRAPATVADLRDMLARHCDEIRVVVVLRRQDLRAVSRYKNLARNRGATERTCLSHSDTMDLDRLMDLWSRPFGRAAMHPILFPDSIAEPADLLEGYCAAAGIDGLYDPERSADYQRNPAVDGRVIDAFRRLNEIDPGRPQDDYPWGLRLVEKKLLDAFSGPPLKVAPARAEAEAFHARYKPGNDRIAREYFPSRATLFDEDFSRWPEAASYPEPGVDDLMRVLHALAFDPRLRRSPAEIRQAGGDKT